MACYLTACVKPYKSHINKGIFKEQHLKEESALITSHHYGTLTMFQTLNGTQHLHGNEEHQGNTQFERSVVRYALARTSRTNNV